MPARSMSSMYASALGRQGLSLKTGDSLRSFMHQKIVYDIRYTAYRSHGIPGAAVVDFTSAIAADAKLVRAYVCRGQAYFFLKRYPEASTLMVTADAGGSNGYRNKLWKVELARLAAETGLTITVCHYPPGTSKWNKIVIYTGIPGVYEVTDEPAPVPEILARARLSASCN